MTYNNQGRFSGRLQDARHLATMIKTVNFKDEQEQFDLRSQQGSQFDTSENTEKWPEGYDNEGRAIFGISLSTLLNCLNMFGTAGSASSSSNGNFGRPSSAGGSGTSGTSGTSGSKYNSTQSGTQGVFKENQAFASAASVTAVKITYDGPGSKLFLTLEDHGVITSCGIPTYDPETPVIHDFNDEVISTVSMKSKWLEEGLRDLDSTSEKVVLRLSPDTPNFRISSLGTVEALDINYSLGDVLDSCQLAYDHDIQVSYNFVHVLNMLRACPLSTSAYIAINQEGFLRVQFLHPVSENHDSNLLVMVIDTNPFEWEHPSAPLKLNEALQHILVFMNAHLAGRHDNKLAVIASHVGVSKFLYPTPNETIPGGKVQTKKDANVYQNFKVVNDAVLTGITRLLQDPRPTLEEKDLGSSKIAASLSLGLCYINQMIKMDPLGHLKPRMLVLTVSPDSSSDYIPIMNCIFSAQKANIPIDVCKIWGEDAVFLQQAAHITEGIYMRPNDPRGLLQVLMFSVAFLQFVRRAEFRMLEQQFQNQTIEMDMDDEFPSLPTFQNERIIFCIDLDLSMDEQFMLGDKPNDTRINRTKQVLKWFIAQKSRWNANHEFAVIILGEKAVWHVDFTTDAFLLEHAIDELYTMGRFPNFDLSSLFELIMQNVDLNSNPHSTVRAITIYTRSDVLPTMADKESMEALQASGRFYFDCIYIHNKASEVSGDIKPQQIYDRLTEMESAQSPGYFYELTRILKKFSGAMGELLANPAVRVVQDEGFPRMPPPPSVRAKQQEMTEQNSQKQQISSPPAKRTDTIY
ncbi:RNA polymerase II transcription factor B subunit 4 [Linnemannia zychae]|nr:RNA polymerase II transcription factor B subunit 4 [Linnemannia zychae]